MAGAKVLVNGLRERLRAQPEVLPGAVEEILRWVTRISHFTRMTTEDSEARGVKIGKHFCTGAHLARVEIETIFRHLLERLKLVDGVH